MSRNRKLLPSAEQVLNEFTVDKDVKKLNYAISLFERRFYDNLYPDWSPKDTISDRFSRLIVAADALQQKEKLELFLLTRDIVEN